jgi:hypothetical protein
MAIYVEVDFTSFDISTPERGNKLTSQHDGSKKKGKTYATHGRQQWLGGKGGRRVHERLLVFSSGKEKEKQKNAAANIQRSKIQITSAIQPRSIKLLGERTEFNLHTAYTKGLRAVAVQFDLHSIPPFPHVLFDDPY